MTFFFLQQMTVKVTTAKLENLETGKIYKIFVVSRNSLGTSLPSSLLLLNITEKSWYTFLIQVLFVFWFHILIYLFKTFFSPADIGNGSLTGVTSPPHSLTISSHSANFVTISWQPPEVSHPAERLYYR